MVQRSLLVLVLLSLDKVCVYLCTHLLSFYGLMVENGKKKDTISGLWHKIWYLSFVCVWNCAHAPSILLAPFDPRAAKLGFRRNQLGADKDERK